MHIKITWFTVFTMAWPTLNEVCILMSATVYILVLVLFIVHLTDDSISADSQDVMTKFW